MQLRSDQLDVRIDDQTLAVEVTDRRSGATWSTPVAAFDMQVYNIAEQHNRWYTTAAASADNPRSKDLGSRCRISAKQVSAKEIEARVDFVGINIAFDVHFELNGAELSIAIPENGWTLDGERHNEVLGVDCLPLFGGRPRGAEGYMVLPHFGGAIRYFADRPDRVQRMKTALNEDPSASYSSEFGVDSEPNLDVSQLHVAMAYGYQTRWKDMIAYPLWGTIVGESGWAAYVPFGRGDADTAVVTVANRGAKKKCGVYGRLCYREHARDTRIAEDRQLVLTFLHEKHLNYAAVGRVYRDYLTQRAGFTSLRDKAKASKETDYLVGAYFARPNMGIKRYCYVNNPNPDGRGILDIYMPYDQIVDEMRRLKRAGINQMLVQIVGANSGGHDGDYPTYFPLEPKMGGEPAFRKTVASLKQLDYRSSVHVNFRSQSRAAVDFNIDHVARDRDGGLLAEGSGPNGDSYHGCPVVVAPEFARRNFHRLKELRLDGGLYTDFAVGILFRCYHADHPATRRGYLEACREYAQLAKRTFGATRMESVLSPILEELDWVARIYVGEVTDNVMRSAEMTARGLADEPTGLQAIVFHGLITYSIDSSCSFRKDPWDLFLQNASFGAKPVEEWRGPQPQWDDFHVLEYRVLVEQMKWLQFEWLQNHETIAPHVMRSTYSDGSVVWVNQSRESFTTPDGRKLAPRSVWVKPGSRAASPEDILVAEDKSISDREPVLFRDGTEWPGDSPREGLVAKLGEPVWRSDASQTKI